MVTALVGATGLIGKVLYKNLDIDFLFDSKNIADAKNQYFDILYCCAPSGNRLLANQCPDADLENVKNLIAVLKSIKIKKLVLISTVDTQHDPQSPYGNNRLLLEEFTKSLESHHIVRLCSLIDRSINKNVLFDLKHQKFLDHINLDQVMHWYNLSDLPTHLDIIIGNNIKIINLVSEPIQTQEIIDMFFSGLNLKKRQATKPYNLICDHPGLCVDKTNYVYTKDQIFHAMKRYLNDQYT